MFLKKIKIIWFFYFKLIFFLVFLDHFDTLIFFKKIILIYFRIKNTFKNNHNYTLKKY